MCVRMCLFDIEMIIKVYVYAPKIDNSYFM